MINRTSELHCRFSLLVNCHRKKERELAILVYKMAGREEVEKALGEVSLQTKVEYRLENLGNDRVKAIFQVPEDAIAQISSKGAVMYIRGGSFQMLKSLDGSQTVYTIFESPLPEMTADAIAERIQFRLENPNSPGMEMLCTVQ